MAHLLSCLEVRQPHADRCGLQPVRPPTYALVGEMVALAPIGCTDASQSLL